MTVSIQREDFDIGDEIAALSANNGEIGAIASFIGKVRGSVDGKSLSTMTLEHYPGMTESELAEIEAQAAKRFDLAASRIIHRIGALTTGDNIVLVITASAHRHAAIAACDFLMDYLKSRAPFWKKEDLADGESQWVDARDSDSKALARWNARSG